MRSVVIFALCLAGCPTVFQAAKQDSAVCAGWKADCKAANALLEADGYIHRTSAACGWYEKECR